MSKEQLEWKVHVNKLLQEIADNLDRGTSMIVIPLNILQRILIQVAKRAIELNDLELNKLMLRLGLYSISNPDDLEYNPDLVAKILGC